MGLHMRPAGMMAKRLAETPCSVVIRCGTRSADAKKSILNVMALAAKCGETVTIEVSGEDEGFTLQGLGIFHCLLSGATRTKARSWRPFRRAGGALFFSRFSARRRSIHFPAQLRRHSAPSGVTGGGSRAGRARK